MANKKQAAYEKSEQYAKAQRDKINSGGISAEQIEKLQKEGKHITTFKYGFFWQTKNKYNVSTYMSNVIDADKSVPIIDISDWRNCESLLYIKYNKGKNPWTRYNRAHFFDGIKQIKLD